MLHCLVRSTVPGSAVWKVDGINQVKTWSNTSNEHKQVQVDLSLTQRVLSAPSAKEGTALIVSSHPLLGSRQALPDVALPADKLMTICRVLKPPLCQRSPIFVSSLPHKHCHKLQGIFQYSAGSWTPAFQHGCKQEAKQITSACLPVVPKHAEDQDFSHRARYWQTAPFPAPGHVLWHFYVSLVSRFSSLTSRKPTWGRGKEYFTAILVS